MIQIGAGLKRFVPVIFSLVMGVTAVVLMRQYLVQQRRLLEQERQRLYADFQSPLEVLVATEDLPRDTMVEAIQVGVAEVPERFVQPYAARSLREVVGMVTLVPIAQGEQILSNKLRRTDAAPTTGTLSSLTPKGKRAVTIAVDTITGVGGFVRPGDAVDILWTVKLPQPGQPEGQIVTLTLFQEVSVLAVAHEVVGRTTQTAEESQQYTVTLALTPQETSFLLFARVQGQIQLSLRARQETGQVAVTPANSVTFNAFMEKQLGLVPAPPLPPRTLRQVEVYKGLDREVVVLSEEVDRAQDGDPQAP